MAGPSSSSSSSRDSEMASRLQSAKSLTIQTLREITDHFSEERKIGQGTYGKVYKAKLENGEEIAVKMLYNNTPGIDDERFKCEFENLMRLEHENIVRLVRYCYETQHEPMQWMGKNIWTEKIYRGLCFEYMQNGSLEKHISDECDGLDWLTRYKIIKGTCQGLKHLHEGLAHPIYHLDLKPDNILLDKNMVPKLADFGLSKLFSDKHTMITQSPMGTIGYLPMEFLYGNVISNKFDVFSLGVVMIKIIGGHGSHAKSAEMPRQVFLDHVQENWRKRMLKTSQVSRPLEAYCEQVNICTEIALSCMEIDRHNRPTIADIVHRLDDTETIINEVQENLMKKMLKTGQVSQPGEAYREQVNICTEIALSCMEIDRHNKPAIADIVHRLDDTETVIDKTLSLMNDNLVKLEVLTKSEEFPYEETVDEYPILVRLTAPPWRREETMSKSNPNVDIVLVIHESNDDRFFRKIRKMMMVLVNGLDSTDRLSIVSGNGDCIMELTFMSDEGRSLSAPVIDNFVARDCGDLQDNVGAAAKILSGREVEKGHSRAGMVIILVRKQHHPEISSEFPVHILDINSDMYTDLWPFNRAIISVTAISITLTAHKGVFVSSIDSGGHSSHVKSDGKSGEIHINHIYPGETMNFIVKLKLGKGRSKLVTIGGQYRALKASNHLLADTGVFVLRPRSGCSPEKLAMHPEVAAELVRLQLMRDILSEFPNSTYVDVEYSNLKNIWEKIKPSEEGRLTPRKALVALVNDSDRYRYCSYDVKAWLSYPKHAIPRLR